MLVPSSPDARSALLPVTISLSLWNLETESQPVELPGRGMGQLQRDYLHSTTHTGEKAPRWNLTHDPNVQAIKHIMNLRLIETFELGFLPNLVKIHLK